MTRRLLALLLAAVTALSLTGCWSRIEVNDLAIVSLMAIDQTGDGQMQIWLQVVIPARAAGTQGGAGSGGPRQDLPFITLVGKGRTLLEASRRIQVELPRRLFWAHTRVILLGEPLARAGVRPALDFLTRHRELRLTNYVLTVREPLETLLAAPVDLDQLPAEYLRELSRSEVGIDATVGDFARDLAAKGADPITGVAEFVPPPEGAPPGQRPSLRLGGSAVYQDDKLAAFLDESQTRGVMWLRNEMTRGTITMPLKDLPGMVSLERVKADVKKKARPEGGKVSIHLYVRAEADIAEQTSTLDLTNPDLLKTLQDEMAGAIKERIGVALDRLREANSDAAGLGETIHQQLPQAWKRLEKQWHNGGFEKTPVVLHVEAYIRRTGLSGKPRGATDEELIGGEP